MQDDGETDEAGARPVLDKVQNWDEVPKRMELGCITRSLQSVPLILQLKFLQTKFTPKERTLAWRLKGDTANCWPLRILAFDDKQWGNLNARFHARN